MNLLVTLLAVAVGVCQGAKYNYYPVWDQDCSYPTWECDCQLVYSCDGTEVFPDDVGGDPTLSGYIKDLAPKEYPLGISGERWRKNKSSSQKFCKRECEDRMNAFLCLDGGKPTNYSYSAVCLKMLETVDAPFTQTGIVGEPCCTIFLQYGPQWCTKKCSRAVGTVRCLTRATIGFSSASNVFGVERGCILADAALGSFIWCESSPRCPTGVAF